MTGPKRIQRKREKGWRMPEGAVYVGRGSIWGNPWRVVAESTVLISQGDTRQVLYVTPEVAVQLYRIWITNAHVHDQPFAPERLRFRELAGRDLACWCPLDQPCHADMLLELANLRADAA